MNALHQIDKIGDGSARSVGIWRTVVTSLLGLASLLLVAIFGVAWDDHNMITRVDERLAPRGPIIGRLDSLEHRNDRLDRRINQLADRIDAIRFYRPHPGPPG